MHISIKNATREVSKKPVFSSVNLEIHSGQVLAVVGMKGSGKASLLRAIAGAVSLSSGEITCDGNLYEADSDSISRSILLLTSPPPFLSEETVLRNISLFLTQYQKMDDAKIGDKISTALDTFDLKEQFESRVEELSAEQAIRLAFLIYSVMEPGVGIFEDLDPSEIADRKNHGTIIYSARAVNLNSDDLAADQICLLNRGQVYATGTPGEIRRLAETDHLIASLTGLG